MNYFCLILAVFLGQFSFGQSCSKLFISEYVEGSLNNKALEIYNPTSLPIDLSQYMIIRYANGINVATMYNAVQLTGIIQPLDVHVAVLERLDPNQTGQNSPVDSLLQTYADAFYCPDYNVSNAFNFTGDDAIVLAKGDLSSVVQGANINTATNFEIVDIFGKIGEWPGSGAWSTVFPHNTGAGVLVTMNHSLVRKSSILIGETNVSIPFFNPLAQWDSLPPNIIVNNELIGNWSTLGFHNCFCDGTTTGSIAVNQCSSYTSPTGEIYTSSGIYLDTLVNSVGADSLLTINYTYSPILDTLVINACLSYTYNGITFTNTGQYPVLVQGICDTLVLLDIFIQDTNEVMNEICAVGVNDNGNNRIVWEKPLVENISYFNIYKESNQSGIYNLIGTRLFSDSSFYVDVNSNPMVQSYRYKISTVDTCGLESEKSASHKTIHLTISQGIGQNYNLIWSHYEGFLYATYSIYRGNDMNNLTLLTTIASNLNSFTDINAPNGPVFYQVVAENPDGCNPSKILNYASSRSNIADSESLNVDASSIAFNIYPNPVNTKIGFEVEQSTLGVEYFLMDQAGRTVKSGVVDKTKMVLDLSSLSNGVYTLSIGTRAESFKIVKQ